MNPHVRSIAGLLAGVALVLPLGYAWPEVASAQCADPSGKCPNGGQVTFTSPQPAPAQRSGPCANPSGCAPGSTGLVTIPAPPPQPKPPVQTQPQAPAQTQAQTPPQPQPPQAQAQTQAPPVQQNNAPCADPSGCAPGNTGLVDMANPDGGQASAQTPDGGQASAPNPDASAAGADGTDPMAGNAGAANPDAGSVDAAASAPQPPQPQPAQAPDVPASTGTQGGATITVNPGQAAVGGAVVVTAQGLNPGGRLSPSLFVNLVGGPKGPAALAMADGSPVRLAADGSLSGTFVVTPKAEPGAQRVCITGQTGLGTGGLDALCTSFTVAGGAQPSQPWTAATDGSTTSDAAAAPVTNDLTWIVGRYQCSSMLQVGRGSSWCTGNEPLLVVAADGTYTWGDRQGTYSAEAATVTLVGAPPAPGANITLSSIGTGAILNRRMDFTTESGGQQYRFTYIRMDR